MLRTEKTRKYFRERYQKRRQWMVTFLGGVCVVCGTTKHLEIDHIDPATKRIQPGSQWSSPLGKLVDELEVCQLLCKTHHTEKTLRDKKQLSARNVHGTLSSYRYCKCTLCRSAKAAYMKRYKQKMASSSNG